MDLKDNSSCISFQSVFFSVNLFYNLCNIAQRILYVDTKKNIFMRSKLELTTKVRMYRLHACRHCADQQCVPGPGSDTDNNAGPSWPQQPPTPAPIWASRHQQQQRASSRARPRTGPDTSTAAQLSTALLHCAQ